MLDGTGAAFAFSSSLTTCNALTLTLINVQILELKRLTTPSCTPPSLCRHLYTCIATVVQQCMSCPNLKPVISKLYFLLIIFLLQDKSDHSPIGGGGGGGGGGDIIRLSCKPKTEEGNSAPPPPYPTHLHSIKTHVFKSLKRRLCSRNAYSFTKK